MVARVGTPITINQFDPASGFATAYNNNGGGSDQCLVVSLAIQNSAQPSITAVTYNGVALTKAVERVSGSNAICNLSIWVLAAPATGSNNVAISYSNGGGGSVGITGYVETLTGVNQIDPIGASETGTDSTGTSNGSQNLNFTITTEEADSGVTFIVSPTSSWTTPTGTTRLTDLSGFGSVSFDTSGFIDADTDAAGAKSFDAPSFSTTVHQFAGLEIKDKATEPTDRNVSGANLVALATQSATLDNSVRQMDLWRQRPTRGSAVVHLQGTDQQGGRRRWLVQRDADGTAGPSIGRTLFFGEEFGDAGVNVSAAQSVALATQSATVTVPVGLTSAASVPLATQAADLDLIVAVTTAQSVALATQAATISAAVALTITAAHSVPLATQAADIDVLVALTAAQAVPLATQSSTIALQVGLTASQSVALATQSADVDVLVQVTSAASVPLATQAADLDLITQVTAAQSVPLATQAATVAVLDQITAAHSVALATQSATLTGSTIITAAHAVPLASQSASLDVDLVLTAAQAVPLATQAASLAVLEQITAAQTVALATQAATVTTINERTITAAQEVPLAIMLAGILSPQPEIIARVHSVRGSHAVRNAVRGIRPSL